MDEAELAVAEAEQLVRYEYATATMEQLLRKALPAILDQLVTGVAERFDREVTALHNRIDRIEGDVSRVRER